MKVAILFAVFAVGAVAQPREFGKSAVSQTCPDFAAGEMRMCAVSEFKEFGSVNGETYYYALYCRVPKYAEGEGKCGDDSFVGRYYARTGLAVFSGDPASDRVTLRYARAGDEPGLLTYSAPEIVRTPLGTVLYLNIAASGTGHFNESEYHLRSAGAWDRIDTKVWEQDLRSRIPTPLEIWKGVWPDLKTMTAEAGLYRKGDGNCCPSGGQAHMKLSIQSGRFVLDSVKFELAE